MPETVDVEAMARRLARLEVAEAAREATWRYALAVDTLDFDLLSDVFTENAVLTTRQGPRQGREEILAYYRKALADPVGRKHFMVNQSVAHVGPDAATLLSYFLYTFAGQDTSILGWGTYHDVVRVVDGVGRIEEKRISIDVHADSRIGWAGQGSA
jgi:ketosteroid isomerase-like protein